MSGTELMFQQDRTVTLSDQSALAGALNVRMTTVHCHRVTERL